MYGSADHYLLPFAVTLAAFVALWGLSLVRRDSSVVDFWWGPGFLAMLGVAAVGLETLDTRDAVLIGLVGAWSLRLGWVLGRRRVAEGHEDPRYTALRRAWDPGFWWKSLGIVFVLQAVIQTLVALGALSTLAAPAAPIGVLGAVGIAVALAGLALETTADAELDAFKRTARPGDLLTTGLRAHVRHPNYLGEIVFWVGIGLLGLEAGAWAGLLSALLIAVLLTTVSGAPMLDERLSETRPGYAAYRRRVPGFVPQIGGRARERQ